RPAPLRRRAGELGRARRAGPGSGRRPPGDPLAADRGPGDDPPPAAQGDAARRGHVPLGRSMAAGTESQRPSAGEAGRTAPGELLRPARLPRRPPLAGAGEGEGAPGRDRGQAPLPLDPARLPATEGDEGDRRRTAAARGTGSELAGSGAPGGAGARSLSSELSLANRRRSADNVVWSSARSSSA